MHQRLLSRVQALWWWPLPLVAALMGIAIWMTLPFADGVSSRQNQHDKDHAGQSASHVVAPESDDERLADYTEALAFFTFMLVIVAGLEIFFLYKTDRSLGEQVRLARDQFTAEHRPWMAIRRREIPSAILVNDTGVRVPFSIHLENTGRTPARNFHMWGGAQVFADPTDLIAAQAKVIADGLKGDPGSLPSEVIFPQGETTHRTVFGAPHARDEEGNFLGPLAGVLIYGAFFYRSPFDDTYHYTSFVYSLSFDAVFQRDDDKRSWPTIPAPNVDIRRYHTGWNAT